MNMRIAVTREKLNAMRGRKDFWSELAFAPGYAMAQTYSFADVIELEATVHMDCRKATSQDWAIPESGDLAWCMSSDWFAGLSPALMVVEPRKASTFPGLPDGHALQSRQQAA